MSLRRMFTGVASRYDFLNRVITLGLDEVWRETCASECVPKGVVIDLCCGTGKLARRIITYLPHACLFGIDFNKAMLSKANQELGRRVALIVADVAYLPLKDSGITHVVMSFSLRNLIFRNPNAIKHLNEIARVLKKTGKFSCIETSQPSSRMMRILLDLYCRRIVPLVGWLISKRKSPYRYLGISVANFLSAEEICALLLRTGFRKASFKHKTLGAVALHTAVK